MQTILEKKKVISEAEERLRKIQVKIKDLKYQEKVALGFLKLLKKEG